MTRPTTFAFSIRGSGNAAPKPFVMRLGGPIRRLSARDGRLLKGHFRRQRMHSERCGVICNMRICEPDIGMP